MINDIMVSVLCPAYNHGKYIRDALEGFVMQKTNFKFEVIVHDDASTDGTADIIREYAKKYPHLIRPIIEEENLNARNFLLLYPYANGKYIALCEGDDYWTDENKLQIQVDFLEQHPEYGMTMHNAVKLDAVTGETRLLQTFEKDGCYSQEQHILAGLGSDFPAYASYMIRADYVKDMPHFFYEPGVFDYPLRQYYANRAKIYYFERPMSVYRVSVANSFMSRTRKNSEAYNNYVLKMLAFYRKLNEYTECRFEKILEKKMDSDYLGFCASIDEKSGLVKATEHGLDKDKIRSCFRQLDEHFLDSRVQKLSAETKHLFICGTSWLAILCRKQLENAGVDFDGFVVSDQQMKMDQIDGKQVFYISEVRNAFSDAGFVLAVQPINVEVIEQGLKAAGFTQYCIPYGV